MSQNTFAQTSYAQNANSAMHQILARLEKEFSSIENFKSKVAQQFWPKYRSVIRRRLDDLHIAALRLKVDSETSLSQLSDAIFRLERGFNAFRDHAGRMHWLLRGSQDLLERLESRGLLAAEIPSTLCVPEVSADPTVQTWLEESKFQPLGSAWSEVVRRPEWAPLPPSHNLADTMHQAPAVAGVFLGCSV